MKHQMALFAEFTNTTELLDTGALYPFPEPKDSMVGKILVLMGRGQGIDSSRKPLKVDCGPKPVNASTNCQPSKNPCLYNVKLDPCEYFNIADQNKGLTRCSIVEYHNCHCMHVIFTKVNNKLLKIKYAHFYT